MQFLLSLPKAALVFLALFVSLMVVMLIQPPHTACQSQLEVFKTSQIGFLYPDPKISYKKTRGYEKAIEICKYGNSAGGCLDYFNGMRRFHRELESVPTDCASEIFEDDTVKKTIWESLEFMVQLAWGAKAPVSYLDRQGWLDTFHLAVFCDLKRLSIKNYGNETWTQFVETQLKVLPQASALSRNESWQRSILSYPCESLVAQRSN